MILAGFEVVSYIDAHARIDLFNTTEFTENTESTAQIATTFDCRGNET